VRVLAASNVDLEMVADAGTFRTDLLYRLNAFKLDLPPLRLRGDDIVLLAETFVAQFCREYGKPLQVLGPATIDFLLQQSWPGNVRQLENLIRRAVFLCDDTVIGVQHATATLGERVGEPRRPSFREAKAQAIAHFERAYLAELLARTGGNITLAARLSGKERSRFTKLVKKHGLDRSAFTGNTSAA